MSDASGTLVNQPFVKRVLSGYVDLLNPTPDMVKLEDISKSLHNQCRYTGNVPCFYSVAEHCLLASRLAKEDGRSAQEVLAVLLHDANEAYLGDFSRPLKLLLRSHGVTILDELAAKWDAAIGQKFGLDLKAHHDVIKYYDNIMLKAEKKRLYPDDPNEWTGWTSALTWRSTGWTAHQVRGTLSTTSSS